LGIASHVDQAAHFALRKFELGAGEGNRTLVVSLGSFCSTIELHPRSRGFAVMRSPDMADDWLKRF
jgi:hypothetical protein